MRSRLVVINESGSELTDIVPEHISFVGGQVELEISPTEAASLPDLAVAGTGRGRGPDCPSWDGNGADLRQPKDNSTGRPHVPSSPLSRDSVVSPYLPYLPILLHPSNAIREEDN